jgi:hypothetical protein
MMVITHNRPHIFIEVEPSDTIKTVKEKIQSKNRIPPNQQTLMFFYEELLEYGCTLSYYDVEQCLIQVLL